jgi:crossover junction endodeoxyribonuclease RuvC
MIILGIDPGTATTGWGIIKSDKNKPSYMNFGVITTSAGLPLEKRLATIYKDIIQLIKKYQVEVMAVENLFFNTNAKTAMLVGQARGVVLLTAELKHLPLFSYTPLQVKIAIVGYGRADKAQVQEMVKVTLDLPQIPKPDDAADALAVALTCCFTENKLK